MGSPYEPQTRLASDFEPEKEFVPPKGQDSFFSALPLTEFGAATMYARDGWHSPDMSAAILHSELTD
jgi:hypothetical protein